MNEEEIEVPKHLQEIKEIQKILRELKRTTDTDGCYNPYNLVYPYIAKVVHEVRELLKVKIETPCKPKRILSPRKISQSL